MAGLKALQQRFKNALQHKKTLHSTQSSPSSRADETSSLFSVDETYLFATNEAFPYPQLSGAVRPSSLFSQADEAREPPPAYSPVNLHVCTTLPPCTLPRDYQGRPVLPDVSQLFSSLFRDASTWAVSEEKSVAMITLLTALHSYTAYFGHFKQPGETADLAAAVMVSALDNAACAGIHTLLDEGVDLAPAADQFAEKQLKEVAEMMPPISFKAKKISLAVAMTFTSIALFESIEVRRRVAVFLHEFALGFYHRIPRD